MSNFECVGINLASEEDFSKVIMKAGESAQPVPATSGNYFLYRESSGVELWVQVNKSNEIIGMNPHFSGASEVKVKIAEKVTRPGETPLDGAYYCWANPQNDEESDGDYPFVFDVPNMDAANLESFPKVAVAQVSAFANNIRLFESTQAFEDSQEGPKFAEQSFIPAGLFSPQGETTNPPTAHAIINGTIRNFELRTNNLVGGQFYWILVDSLGGSFDVVASLAQVQVTPRIGGVVSGEFWLSGRVTLETKVKPKKSLFARLLGK